MPILFLKRSVLKAKSITVALAVVAAIVLPQIFHLIGLISGTGNMLGSAFLPMYLPVIIAGLLGGPVVGFIAGAVSPLVSYIISGMPTVTLLPYIIIEISVFGLVSGILSKVKMPLIAKLIITQVAGRTTRLLAIAAIFVFNSQTVQIVSIWNVLAIALPGIVLQWALVPLLMHRIEGLKKYYD
jgi:LytS/YehU family sensor histidine kinase